MNRDIKLNMLFIILGLLVFIGGCTYIGYSAGKSIDNSTIHEKTIAGWKIGEVHKNRLITVTLQNGDSLRGIYTGIAPESDSAYTEEYEKFRAGNPENLVWPAIGEKLDMESKQGTLYNLTLCGFEYRYRELPDHPGERSAFEFQWLSFKDSTGKSGHIYLSDIVGITSPAGNVIDGMSLRSLSSRSELPLSTSIMLQTIDGVRMIPAEKIDHASVSSKGIAKWIGLGLGIAADSFLILYMIAGILVGEGLRSFRN